MSARVAPLSSLRCDLVRFWLLSRARTAAGKGTGGGGRRPARTGDYGAPSRVEKSHSLQDRGGSQTLGTTSAPTVKGGTHVGSPRSPWGAFSRICGGGVAGGSIRAANGEGRDARRMPSESLGDTLSDLRRRMSFRKIDGKCRCLPYTKAPKNGGNRRFSRLLSRHTIGVLTECRRFVVPLSSLCRPCVVPHFSDLSA